MRQLARPSDTLSGWRLVRVEEAEGLMRPWWKLVSSNSLTGGPTRNWVVRKGGTRARGQGRTPPFLCHRHAASVGPYN